MNKAEKLKMIWAKVDQSIKEEHVVSNLFVSVTGFGLPSIDKLYLTKQKPNSNKCYDVVIDLSKDFQEYRALEN